MQAKITDLGVSRVLDATGVASTVTGTSAYMAPELATGSYDGRVDVYSLAVTMGEFVLQHVPCPGKPLIPNPRITFMCVTRLCSVRLSVCADACVRVFAYWVRRYSSV